CERVPEPPLAFMGRDVDCGPPATLEDLQGFFPSAPLRIDGRRVESPIDAYELTPSGSWEGHTIDLPAMLADGTPRQIRLAGFFQRTDYFMPPLDRLRRWFELTPIALPHAPGPRDVVVSIRRGVDYGVQGWTLGMTYYRHVLAGLADIGRVYVCGTCIDDQ